MFFKFVLLFLIVDSFEALPPENPSIPLPKSLQQINEIVAMHLSALANCIKSSEGVDPADRFGIDQRDNSSNNCLWECILTNVDMMKDGHLEYVGSEENEILKEAFDKCSKKDAIYFLKGCKLAHLFLMCEYSTWIEKAATELSGYYKNSLNFFMDLQKKLDMVYKNILMESFTIHF